MPTPPPSLHTGCVKMGAGMVLGVVFFGIDQITKAAIHASDAARTSIPGITLEATTSPGLIGTLTNNTLAIFIPPAVIILCLWWFAKAPHPLAQWGVVLIISGGASNLVDRLRYEAVRDIITINTLTLNIADLLVAIGAGLIAVSLYSASSRSETRF